MQRALVEDYAYKEKMTRLIDEITSFLQGNGIACSKIMSGEAVVAFPAEDTSVQRLILPIEIEATTPEQAVADSATLEGMINSMPEYPLIIVEDRWRRQGDMTRKRLLAHLGIYQQVFARNCEVRRVEKALAQDFLGANHSYAYAACKYHYGLFLKRPATSASQETLDAGTLVAIATFSKARKWMKAGVEIRSYEWTRYASIPNLRISGGMGKMLKAFIKDVNPDDVMSYADLEWSEGEVYRKLGFEYEGTKSPVFFAIDSSTWQRHAIASPVSTDYYSVPNQLGKSPAPVFFQNFGSAKYRLKLTEYK